MHFLLIFLITFLWQTSYATSLFEEAEQLKKADKVDQAITVYTQALNQNPHDFNTLFGLATSYTVMGQSEQAIMTYNHILTLFPNHVATLYNIGYTLKMVGRVDEAIAYYKKVLTLDPTYEMAHFALGHAYLYKGDFAAGWQQHQRYLKREGRNAENLRKFLATDTLNNKIILMRADGGMGDTLQFIRYAKLLKEKGAIVHALVQKSLIPLIARIPYIDKVMNAVADVGPFHDWLALMAAPAIFNHDAATFPRAIPYIYPDPTLVEQWHAYLAHDQQFKIGLCWQADVYNDSSRPPVARRGIPLEKLYCLKNIQGISLYSLQQKDGTEQLHALPEVFDIHVFNETFDALHGAFMDTAAVIQNLDLVITVDTAVAHLAGALGKPVWLLLPYATDWRWIVNRTDSPWYPSMRIFKQSQPFDWDNVVKEVITELRYATACLGTKTIG